MAGNRFLASRGRTIEMMEAWSRQIDQVPSVSDFHGEESHSGSGPNRLIETKRQSVIHSNTFDVVRPRKLTSHYRPADDCALVRTWKV
jgi:hypothetical protein